MRKNSLDPETEAIFDKALKILETRKYTKNDLVNLVQYIIDDNPSENWFPAETIVNNFLNHDTKKHP